MNPERRALHRPGLTRDSISIEWEHEGRSVRLIDTAGVRKWGKARCAPLGQTCTC